MLVRSGDLIPVKAEAARIPWTKRKSHVLNHLHRGPVDFDVCTYFHWNKQIVVRSDICTRMCRDFGRRGVWLLLLFLPHLQTYVYDTNVGDVAKLSSYFNPDRWTVHDLNNR